MLDGQDFCVNKSVILGNLVLTVQRTVVLIVWKTPHVTGRLANVIWDVTQDTLMKIVAKSVPLENMGWIAKKHAVDIVKTVRPVTMLAENAVVAVWMGTLVNDVKLLVKKDFMAKIVLLFAPLTVRHANIPMECALALQDGWVTIVQQNVKNPMERIVGISATIA